MIELWVIIVSQGDIVMAHSLKNRIVALLKKGKTYKEICKSLKCVKGTVAYHSKNSGITSKNKPHILTQTEIEKIQEFYLTHTQTETAKQFNISRTSVVRYCPNKRVPLTAEESRKRNYLRIKNSRLELKTKAVEYKGGKCEKCGYSKCIQALDFHHKNPTHKDFSISQTRLYYAWDKIKKELDKCLLVCSNCHREIHNPPLV